MIDSFLRYIEYEKRYSAHTVSSYKNDLLQFRTFLTGSEPNLSIKSASFQHIRAWVISLIEDGIKPASVNRKIAALRSYYKFLLKRDEIKVDPSQRLQLLKSGKKLPQFVQEQEIQRLLDQFKFEDSFKGSRDRLVLELFYGTGIRRAEMIGLRESDVNLVKQQIKVLGKRNKERIIPLSKSLARLIEEYREKKLAQFATLTTNSLLVTDQGKPCYPMFVYRVVVKHLGKYVSLEKRSPHILRHTFATHLLNKGADLNAVKDLLGHTSLAATQIYTHNSFEKLKRVFDQAHPKA
jgi:integrase/recombinase XerC